MRKLRACCADLPMELLHRIFSVATNSESITYYNKLYTLMLVCRAWRDIILQTPKFWSVLDGKPFIEPRSYALSTLQSSQDATATGKRLLIGHHSVHCT